MTGPSKPLGMSDFFALEAGEYLERLDGLLAKGESPSADELVRLARALRGSALMANQPAIARAAAGLEALSRAVREGRRAWDAATRHLAVRGVDALKVFVRRAARATARSGRAREPRSRARSTAPRSRCAATPWHTTRCSTCCARSSRCGAWPP